MISRKSPVFFCIIAVLTMLTVFAACSSLPPWLADFDEPASAIGEAAGSATGTGQGFGGAVTVTLTLEGGWITEVTAAGPGETPSIGGIALARASELIKKRNGADFEAVSGATITSNGIKAAAQQALDQILAAQ
jgi:fumarate reductase flavoprotein subunit